jgi:CheY-like chemotaxis protein/MinD-like ATPase involved in chromosome partitioning or flagellar assembly
MRDEMPEKIQIVDDDLETVRLVSLMLQRQGYQIISAINGTQALELARSDKPDLIILDIMMPDLDGYQVTRQLRGNPETANIPILIFTARGQVEDKVAGYDTGVDDYLTKPIHPAELVAHVKSLLARAKKRGTAKIERGYIMGVLAPRGGMGTSSLVLNLAINLHNHGYSDVIAAEMRPGHGTWGIDLGLTNPTGLENLLRRKPAEITPSIIDTELVRTTYGVRLLMASNHLKDVELQSAAPQIQSILQHLPTLAPVTLLDIGANSLPDFEHMVAFCNDVIVITEPFPSGIHHVRVLIEELVAFGFGKSRLVNLVVINRVRADMQLSIQQIQDALGVNPMIVIPPGPEVAFQAGIRNLPLMFVQPESLLAMQYKKLADLVDERITAFKK